MRKKNITLGKIADIIINEDNELNHMFMKSQIDMKFDVFMDISTLLDTKINSNNKKDNTPILIIHSYINDKIVTIKVDSLFDDAFRFDLESINENDDITNNIFTSDKREIIKFIFDNLTDQE